MVTVVVELMVIYPAFSVVLLVLKAAVRLETKEIGEATKDVGNGCTGGLPSVSSVVLIICFGISLLIRQMTSG